MRWPSLNPLRLKPERRRNAVSAGPLRAQLEPERRDATLEQAEPTEPATGHAAGPAPHLALGRRGEALAAQYLARQGYQLVAANFKLPVGRTLRGALVHAEIDLIAYDGQTLCFVEVKTRASDWYAPPEANVDLRKQRQVSRAARVYRRLFGLTGAAYRYDVVSVTISPTEAANAAPRLQLLRNFWTDDKFRKRRWSNEHDPS